MADNFLNPDLGPVTWTTGAAAREPRGETRDRGKRGDAKKPVTAASADLEPASAPGSESAGEEGITGEEPHRLDRFA